MRSPRHSKRSRLHTWLEEHAPAIIDVQVLEEIRRVLAPVSDRYLRDLVRNSGQPMTPEVEGVNTHTFEDLERTLVAMAGLYENGRREVRATVIGAKDRLRWAQSRSADPARNECRGEMILWVLTWLENPGAFPLWVAMRRKVNASTSPGSGG